MKTVFIRPAFLVTTLLLALPAVRSQAQTPAPAGAQQAVVNPAGPRAEMLQRFDANKDGKLDPSERENARKQARKIRRGALLRYDADNDGQLSETERSAAVDDMLTRPKAVKRFDTDGDGQLSEAEKTAAREQIEQRIGRRR